MNRARASVPPDAIRIEDEVWQEAFRETTRSRARTRLRSVEGGRSGARAATPRPVAHRRTSGPGLRSATAPVPAPGPFAVGEVSDRPAVIDYQAVWDGEPVSEREPVAGRHVVTGGGAPALEAPARRTVTITGRGAERHLPWPSDASRRRERRAHERVGFRPDRVALWAVFLGVLLVLVAALSAHA